MDLRDKFIQNIYLPFKEYLINKEIKKVGLQKDFITSINLSTSLYHFREYLPINIQLKRSQISSSCPDYDLLGDVVNASKHNKITNNNPKITNSENIQEIIVSTEYKDTLGTYKVIEKTILLRLEDGTTKDLHEVLVNVMNYWLQFLENHKLTEHIKPFQVKKPIPKRSKKAESMDLIAMQKVGFKLGIMFQKYNYLTDTIEPIDISGCKFKFNVYTPNYIVDLTLTDNKTGKKYKLEVNINEDEKKEFDKIKDQQEKLLKVLKLAKEQGIIN